MTIGCRWIVDRREGFQVALIRGRQKVDPGVIQQPRIETGQDFSAGEGSSRSKYKTRCCRCLLTRRGRSLPETSPRGLLPVGVDRNGRTPYRTGPCSPMRQG
jgi:hypothetical protein